MVSLIERGFLTELARDGRNLKNLRTEISFRATVNRAGEVNPPLDLGDDPRMDASMEYRKTGAPVINRNDTVVDADSGEKWSVVKMEFTCPPYALKRGLVQIVPDLDS